MHTLFYAGSMFDNISTAPSADVSARTSKRVSNASFMGVPSTPPPSILSPQLSVNTDNGQYYYAFSFIIDHNSNVGLNCILARVQ